MPGGTPIPTHALILSEALGERLGAQRAAEAIAAGLAEGGAPEADLCPTESAVAGGEAARQQLEAVDFDVRMRSARAVLLVVASLEESTLAGSLAFEAATRARQGGVPCYAVTAGNRLNGFDLRILDLQVVIEATTPTALRAAGRRLASII